MTSRQFQHISNSTRGSADRKKCTVPFTLILWTLFWRYGTTTTCSVMKTALGGNTAIECAFAQDVNPTSVMVVYLYKPKFTNKNTDNRVQVFRCGIQHCIENGQSVDDVLSSKRLTFRLSNVSEQDEGDYSCQILPVNEPIQVCPFKADAQQLLPVTLTTQSSSTSKTENVMFTVQSTESFIGLLTVQTFIAVVCCSSIVGAILFVAVFFVCARKCRRRKPSLEPTATEAVSVPMACTEDHPVNGNTPDGPSVFEPLLPPTTASGVEENEVIEITEPAVKLKDKPDCECSHPPPFVLRDVNTFRKHFPEVPIMNTQETKKEIDSSIADESYEKTDNQQDNLDTHDLHKFNICITKSGSNAPLP